MAGSPEEEKSLAWDLDEVLTDLKFGNYQLRNLLLIGLMIMYTNIYPLSYTLTTADINYRCRVPECDGNTTVRQYNTSWMQEAIPFNMDNQPYKCKRYKPLTNITLTNDSVCTTGFDRNNVEDCDDWIFETSEKTIVNSFNILCENRRWELTMIGTINNLGQFIGTPLFGVVSDRFGRKFVAVSCSIISSIFGFCRGLSTNYFMFATFEFLDTFFASAIYGTVFILGIELVNPKMRPIAATIIGVFYPVGAVIMGFVGWYFEDWKKLLLVCYSPGILFVFYYWLIPESIRWLQTNGYHSEAVDVLKKISKSNKIKLSHKVLEDQRQSMQKLSSDEERQPFWKPLATIFGSKYILLRLLNCSFSWFTNTFVYYGLSIYSVELLGNKYMNFILTNAVEIPAFLLSGLIMKKMKRRVSQSSAFFLSGVACLICEFISPDMHLLRLILYLIGKFLITISFNILYIYTAEMFPTELRLSLCGFASMIGRIGSMLAPQTLLLKDVVGKHAPVLLFGGISMIAGGLATSFPETLNRKLPDTVHQAKMENAS